MELKMHDLMRECEKCAGSGVIEYDPRSGGAFGRNLVYRTSSDCTTCAGRGFILTESGEVVIEFIQKVKKAHIIG